MVLRRYTRPIDGTIPVQALLYDDEELLASQENVGIYDGLQKAQNYQSGTIYATSHRLFYIDSRDEASHSFTLDLSYVTQTEYYAGLFSSSPKVTIHLTANATSGKKILHEPETAFESWECEVCAYRNPPGLSPAAARICGLCGVPRRSILAPSKSTSSHHLSSSLPNSSAASALSSSASLTESASRGRRLSAIECPACTFLNHPSLRECEICSTELPHVRRELKSAPSSRPASPDSDDENDNAAVRIIKISFRKGGDKPFYAVLKRSLKSKAWEARGISATAKFLSTSSDAESSYDKNNIGRSGISGILRTVETSAQGRQTHMKDALQDLEALMIQAKDMVRLAAELNEKLTAVSSTSAPSFSLSQAASSTSQSSVTTLVPTTEPEEATFIRSSLSQLGLQMANTPVTLDMMKDERKWIDEMARELASVLQGSVLGKKGGGMMKDRGIVALDEVWGGWNRARGVALIPPSTLLQVIPHLPVYTDPPIRQRTFASGLSVLHTPQYTPAAFSARLFGFLTMSGPKTTIEIAMDEDITVSLAKEMIDDSEKNGDICRDDGSNSIIGGGIGTSAELRWWVNMFAGYTWDGES